MSDDDLCVRCDTPIETGDRFVRIPTPNLLNDDAEIVAHEACVQVARKDAVGFTPDDGHAGRFNEDADGEWTWDDETPIKPD